jgi:CubicO group peptidase (beta-lactamase class C family)
VIVRGDAAQRVDAFLSRLAGFDYSGSILIEMGGEIVLRKAYGFADRSRGIANRPDAVFDIGSMSKQFTAAAVLVLQQEGKVSVTDAIGKLLPDVPADKKEITVQQLLTHTAGLPSDFPMVNATEPDYEQVARDEAVRRVLAAPLVFRPGSNWAYSNCGYILLAAIVERASGTPFPDYVRETIFRPAGLTHTGFWCDAELKSRSVALGHDAFGTVLHDPRTRPLSWCDLGGGESGLVAR